MCVPRAPLTAHLKGWRTPVRHSDRPYKEQDFCASFQPLTESCLVLLLGLSPKRAQLWLQTPVTLDFPTGRCEHSAAPAPRGSLPAALPLGHRHPASEGPRGPRSQFKTQQTHPHVTTQCFQRKGRLSQLWEQEWDVRPPPLTLPEPCLVPTAASLLPMGIQQMRTSTREPPTCSTSGSTPEPQIFSQASEDPQSVFAAP